MRGLGVQIFMVQWFSAWDLGPSTQHIMLARV